MTFTHTLAATVAAFIITLSLQTPASSKPATEDREAVHVYIQSVASKRVADRFTGPIVVAAGHHKLPPVLIAKVVHRESDFDPGCVSDACIGLMQVNPHYWARKGENMYRTADNLEAGCLLLAYLHGRFGNWPQTLTAYNYGENHPVTRGGGGSRYAYLVLSGK